MTHGTRTKEEVKGAAATTINGWKKLAIALGMNAESAIDNVRTRARRRFRPDQRLQIVPYRGFGNHTECRITGRVLTYREAVPDNSESLWKNLADSYRRFETDEVADECVSAEVDGHVFSTRSDEEGYFELLLPTPAQHDKGIARFELNLPEHEASDTWQSTAIVPEPQARFGIISDIDDTVMVTNATSILRMMRLTLLESSDSRLAFPGVAAFYNALHEGGNPFFYVSSSPWNLYDFLDDFMRLKGLVPGPILLRDFGLDRNKFVTGAHRDHKLSAIRRVLDRYPKLPFVLVGDSGQHDPEIYCEIVSKYPGRIIAIYIRDVSGDIRDREVQGLVSSAATLGVPMLLVPDTLAAAHHAATLNLIGVHKINDVKVALSEDLAPRIPLDQQEN